MISSENTIAAEGPSDFFKNLDKKGLIVSKKGQKTFQITQDEPWLIQTLLVHLLLESLKRFHQHHLK